ncbi:hypothetical protein [Paraburkholderia strydomiana]|jgi:hypothetical protein|uniref:hypothetical protein n=1 Tax=Paraburkholderia strydomiana TaxID=1245417 RepID=UPI0038BD16A2
MAADVVVTLPEQQVIRPIPTAAPPTQTNTALITLFRRRTRDNHGLFAIGMQLAFWRYRLTDQANYSML